MRAEEIREGDIVEIDYIAEFTKEHINEGKALVIWKGFNHQPLVRKLNTRVTIWTCYEHIARVIGHIDIEGYMDEILSAPQEREDKGMIVFTLTLPGMVGKDDNHVIVKPGSRVPEDVVGKSFWYRWNDEWAACVSVEKVDCETGNLLRKKSKGFCDYDWMVDSIIKRGVIESVSEGEE